MKLFVGKNDLGTLRPDLVPFLVDASLATRIAPSSHKKVEWKCRGCRQRFLMAVATRSRASIGCPYCSGRLVKKGVNDLRTANPKLAGELVDKRIATTVTGRSSRKVLWRCKKGHPPWIASISDRADGHGCPYCSGRRAWVGKNDLATTHPRLARDLVDRSLAKTLGAGSRRRVAWKCPNHDEHYLMTPHHRTNFGQGCPFCANRRVLVGFNDLATTDPKLAKELVDRSMATKVTRGTSSKRLQWKCKKGHTWTASPNMRTGKGISGCPVCHGSIVLAGANDIGTTHPHIASELVDQTVRTRLVAGSNVRVEWKCEKGHRYTSTPDKRISRKQGCPYCVGKRVMQGFNDVATTRPDVARSFADKSLARCVTAGSNRRVQFVCENCHGRYCSPISRRAQGHGCPSCAIGGFDKTLGGYFYLMERSDEMQIGITNYPHQRIGAHIKEGGWKFVECVGPYAGDHVLGFETRIKRWLKQNIGTIAGTTENWKKRSLMVGSLEDLFEEIGFGLDEVVLHLNGGAASKCRKDVVHLKFWSPR